MRKIFILALLTIFLLPTVNPAAAQSYGPSVIEKDSIENFKDYTFEDILSLKPFVHVEDGFFVFNENGASEAGIDSILIKGQQEYFIFLNQQVKLNAISVASDLTIQRLSNNNENQNNTFIRFTRCRGVTTSPEYFWWGYKTKLSSCDTAKVSSDAGTVAAGGAITNCSWGLVPSFACCWCYFWTDVWLLSERLNANNKGSGVIVDMTWATIYNITSQ